MIVENTRIALIGLRSNKLRSVLTMLGITIGVAAVRAARAMIARAVRMGRGEC